MNKFLLNVDFVMVMDILPRIVRKKVKRIMLMRKMSSEILFRKQEIPT